MFSSFFRPECCGVPVISFWEKLGQTIVYMLRVIFAYFAMFCLMTMNIWLLISIVVGALIGYGVGKPLVANQIHDSITSHGYESVQIKLTHPDGHLKNNRSQRSRSWRYQPINRPDIVLKTRQFDEDLTFSDNGANDSRSSADIVWIRRSSDDLRMKASESSVFGESDMQVRTIDEPLMTADSTNNFDSIKSDGRQSTRSASRFRSTSKVINDSFRSYKSESEVAKYNASASTSANVSFESNTLDMLDRRCRVPKRSASKVSRSTSTSSSRFKPVSREIMRQMSFNSEFD